MSFQYTYLLMTLMFLVIWLVLFLLRKDFRSEMLKISIIFAIAGPLSEIVYLRDWWRPVTITGTAVGIEPAIVGFGIAGVASVLYKFVFNEKYKSERGKKSNKTERMRLAWILVLFAVVFFGGTYLLNISSLYITILAFGLPALVIYFRRRDLIVTSLVSGFLLLIVASLVYSILSVVTPGWIEAFYLFYNTPKIILFNVPIDDIVWYFMAGAFIGPLYEYWKGKKLVSGR